MKNIFLVISLLFFSHSIHAQQTQTAKKIATAPTLSTFSDSLSYAIGLSVGEFYKNMGVEKMNPEVISNAIQKVYNNDTSRWKTDYVESFLMKAYEKVSETRLDETTRRSMEFLEKNKSKPGIITTASGLQYKVLLEGEGPKPIISDTVVCHYSGNLIDGTEFDNSYKRGEPISFPVAGVIKGWTEALQLMSKGSKWQLFIPAHLAYGTRGAGKDIPPGATLIFVVELQDIKKANLN